MTVGKSKKVLLISPNGNLPNYCLPLSLGYLKSNVSGSHEVKVFDLTLEKIETNSLKFREEIQNINPDVVGVTVSIQTYNDSINTLKVTKEINNNIVTIMGGAHPTIYPNFVMKQSIIDYLLTGEGELPFSYFLDNIDNDERFNTHGLVYRKNGTIFKNKIWLDEDLDKIKIPDYNAIKLIEYISKGYNYGGFYGKTAPIWLTRGCPYKCSFCSASLINGTKIRSHSIPYAVQWISHLYDKFNIRQFAIVDDNFTFYIDYAKEFCESIIKLRENGHFREKIYFATPNGIRIERVDDELLRMMKRTGWKGLTVAPESGSRKTLKRMHKNLDPDAVPNIVDRIKSAGLYVRGFFMVGFPGETHEDIEETIKLIRKTKFDNITIGRFLPIPGTPIFDELVNEGEISPDYIPPSGFELWVPTRRDTEKKMYTPKGLEDLNLFKLMLRETLLHFLRNPGAIIYFFKYYGFMNILKKMFFLSKH